MVVLLLMRFSMYTPLVSTGLTVMRAVRRPALPSSGGRRDEKRRACCFRSKHTRLPGDHFLPYAVSVLIGLFTVPRIPMRDCAPIDRGPKGIMRRRVVFYICHVWCIALGRVRAC